MVSAHGEPPLNHLPQDKRLGRGDVPFFKISIPCGASLSPAAGLFSARHINAVVETGVPGFIPRTKVN
jgi:hypothetical protein